MGQENEDKVLTVEEILAAIDLPRDKVPTPEWGGVTLVRAMSGFERTLMVREQKDIPEDEEGNKTLPPELELKIVWWAAINPDGTRLFGGPADLEALKRKNGDPISRCMVRILELSDLIPEDKSEGELTDADPTESEEGSPAISPPTPDGSSPTD